MGTRRQRPVRLPKLFKGLLILLVAPACAVSFPALAQYERLGFRQFKHTAWTSEHGAPEGIGRIAQTPDGWLWLATSDGLYRFDGVTFERIRAPAGSPMENARPQSLMVSARGELWIGFSLNGGVAVYRNGQLVDLAMQDPPPDISFLAQTPDGTVWASSLAERGYLARFRSGRWERAEQATGWLSRQVASLRASSNGSLWAVLGPELEGGPDGELVQLPPGGRLRIVSPRVGAFGRLAVDREGRLWISDAYGTRVLATDGGKQLMEGSPIPNVAGFSRGTLSFDGQGGVWGSTGGGGTFYAPNAAAAFPGAGQRPYQFVQADGLTSNSTDFSLVDREGNIWVGTARGLDQFRPAKALVEPALSTQPSAGLDLARGSDGSVYISSIEGVFHIARGKSPRRILDRSLHGICGARDGGIWGFEGRDRIVRFRDGRWNSLELPAGIVSSGACAEDQMGRLWITLVDRRLMWRDQRGWHMPGSRIRKSQHLDLTVTPEGDIAFRSFGHLVTIRGNSQTVVKVAAAEELWAWAVDAGARDMFLGGFRALYRVRGRDVHRLDGRRFPWVTEVRGLVQTRGGETWMVRRDGVYRIATADLDRAFEDPGAPLPHTRLNHLDGVDSATQAIGFQGKQMGVDADGRIWFLSATGASFIDPARLRPDRSQLPVAIRSLATGGRVHRDPSALTLPAGTRSLEIDYTALSLAVPQRVQFRYRLEGVDDDWVDAGTRRLASYTNLGPGEYRFQVIASNGDGVWNNSGATLQFEIEPTFLQSWLFRILIGLALLAGLWLAYSLRLRAVAHRIRQRMAERIGERERIARELHDTLLQSVQSLTLRFQLAVDDLPATAQARSALEDAIDRADRVIAEGRDRVRDLRPLQDTDIEQIIADIVARQAFGPEVAVSVRSSGTPRPLDPLALDEASRIASEAIFNIWRHSDATNVTIDIAYGLSFALRFADNGKGIDTHILEGGKPGHFGLAGMRERAGKLSGELAIRRLPEGGTEVLLTVPGSIAYKPGSRWLLPRFGNSD